MRDVALLRQAVEDASWLLERGYPMEAAAEFVATHRALTPPQRALLACNARLNASCRHHIAREMDAEDVRKHAIVIDVSSALGTVGSALAEQPLLESSAGVLLDSTWRRDAPLGVLEPALTRIADVLDELRPASVQFVMAAAQRSAVENALGGLGKRKWKVQPQAVDNVVSSLRGGAFVVSSDPDVLDACRTWVNVVGLAIDGLNAPRLRLST